MRAPSRRAEIRAGGRQPCNAGGRSGYLRFAPNAPTYVPVSKAPQASSWPGPWKRPSMRSLPAAPPAKRPPMGVAVFDAQTSEPAALNLEARRMVEALGLPGSSGADVRPKRS